MNEAEYMTMFEAEDAHWWYTSLHALILRQVPQATQAARILDAGCGTGRLLQLLAGRGAAEGCDASETALAFCRKRGLTSLNLADLNTLRLEQEWYDVITSIDVLYHRNIRDDESVLSAMFRAMKPGGKLILQVPAYEWLRGSHDAAVHTGRRYTRNQAERMVKACGFLIEKATYRVSLLFVPIVLVRFIRKAVRRSGAGADEPSDVRKHTAAVNALLAGVMRAENALLKRISLPFGASIFIVARKPGKRGVSA